MIRKPVKLSLSTSQKITMNQQFKKNDDTKGMCDVGWKNQQKSDNLA